MRVLSIAFCLTLVAAPVAAQTTYCNPVGRTVICNTTPAPQPNYQLQNSMSQFGADLGYRLAERRAAQAATEEASLQRGRDQVAAFAADPANPYFGLVRADMATLIESGHATSLRDAYDIAVARSSQVRALQGIAPN